MAAASTAAASASVARAAGAAKAEALEGEDGLVPGYSVRLLGPRNPRNIPTMKFIDDIDGFIKEEACSTETLLQALTTMHGKYKMMEQAMVSNRQRMQGKQPDIRRSLEAITRLQKARSEAETIETRFNLSDNVFAQAEVAPTDKVYLWLGVNVLVEYTLDEAHAMLTKSLTDVKAKEAQYSEDLELVREQAITTEVNMSRSFNYDVQERRKAKT